MKNKKVFFFVLFGEKKASMSLRKSKWILAFNEMAKAKKQTSEVSPNDVLYLSPASYATYLSEKNFQPLSLEVKMKIFFACYFFLNFVELPTGCSVYLV